VCFCVFVVVILSLFVSTIAVELTAGKEASLKRLTRR